jgi:hypothetical protein
MTPAPETTEPPDVGLPRDPADYSLRRNGLGLGFWVAMGFTAFCVLAAVIVSRYGPVLFPIKPANPPPAAASPARSIVAAAGPVAAPIAPPPQALVPAPSEQLLALSGRLERLETDQRRAARASAEALAAAELSDAAQSSQPFAAQLAGVDRLLPDSADLRALQPLAASGAPSRAALAAELAGLTDRAAVAARAPASGGGLFAHITHARAAVFTVRRVDRITGNDPDAVLARAQQHANDGDIDGALKTLDALPRGGQDSLAEWRAQAQRRVAIDRPLAGLRAAALRDLTPQNLTPMSEAWASP